MGGSGLDRIHFFRIRTGLGLKNFTVRSSLQGGSCPRCQLSWVAIVLGGNFPGGSCPVAIVRVVAV